MPTQDDLAGLGMAWPLAAVLGFQPSNITATGTTQGTAAQILTRDVTVSASAGNTGIKISATPKIGSFTFVTNLLASTASCIFYIPLGAKLNGVTNGTATLAAGQTMFMFQVSLNNWSAFFASGGSGSFESGVSEVITPLNTVGAGTITGAGIAGGVTTRGGAQSGTPFTDTTDTATAILAATANVAIGGSWEYTYVNNTNATATLQAGSGVTLSGTVVIPANSWTRFLVTYSAAGAFTMAAIIQGQIGDVPPAKFTTAALSVGTLAAGSITGAAFTVLTNTGATPGAQTVRTAAQMLADIPGAAPGFSSMIRIGNTGAGTFTLTADGGATVTITGTNTIAQNVFRDYVLTFNSATTATIQFVGAGVMT